MDHYDFGEAPETRQMDGIKDSIPALPRKTVAHGARDTAQGESESACSSHSNGSFQRGDAGGSPVPSPIVGQGPLGIIRPARWFFSATSYEDRLRNETSTPRECDSSPRHPGPIPVHQEAPMMHSMPLLGCGSTLPYQEPLIPEQFQVPSPDSSPPFPCGMACILPAPQKRLDTWAREGTRCCRGPSRHKASPLADCHPRIDGGFSTGGGSMASGSEAPPLSCF